MDKEANNEDFFQQKRPHNEVGKEVNEVDKEVEVDKKWIRM